MGALDALGALPQDVLNRDVAMAGTDPAVWRAVLQAQPGPRDEAFWVRALKTIPKDVVLHMQAHPEAVDAALISAIGRGRRTQLLGPACAALLARREQGRPDDDGLTPLDHVLARAALTFKAGRHRRYDDIGNAPLNVRRRLEHLRSAYQSLCAHGADSAASHTRLRARYGTGLDQAVRAIVRAWNSAPDAPVDNRDSRALPRRR